MTVFQNKIRMNKFFAFSKKCSEFKIQIFFSKNIYFLFFFQKMLANLKSVCSSRKIPQFWKNVHIFKEIIFFNVLKFQELFALS